MSNILIFVVVVVVFKISLSKHVEKCLDGRPTPELVAANLLLNVVNSLCDGCKARIALPEHSKYFSRTGTGHRHL